DVVAWVAVRRRAGRAAAGIVPGAAFWRKRSPFSPAGRRPAMVRPARAGVANSAGVPRHWCGCAVGEPADSRRYKRARPGARAGEGGRAGGPPPASTRRGEKVARADNSERAAGGEARSRHDTSQTLRPDQPRGWANCRGTDSAQGLRTALEPDRARTGRTRAP